MPLPDRLGGAEYWDNLSHLRDEALVNSRLVGRRRRVGNFLVFGRAMAYWNGEAEESAVGLSDRGLRINNETMFTPHPTIMRALTSYDSGAIEVTTFQMRLDDVGDMEVYRSMSTAKSIAGIFAEIVRAELSKPADRRHEMASPTDEDLAFVYAEMERGASGLYAPYTPTPES